MADAQSGLNPTPSERQALAEMLDWYRDAVRRKLDGLTDADSMRVTTPSGVTLLGLLRHLVEVERWWWRGVFLATDPTFRWCDEDPDRDWHVTKADTLSEALAAYDEETNHGRALLATAESLDVLSAGTTGVFDGRRVNLRWIMVHLIEETARHAGHADILRESTDGATGD